MSGLPKASSSVSSVRVIFFMIYFDKNFSLPRIEERDIFFNMILFFMIILNNYMIELYRCEKKRRIFFMRLIMKWMFAVVFVFSPMTSASALGMIEAKQMDKLNVVALGDSLAAGQTPYKTKEKGYADYFADMLKKGDRLQSFDKRYATSGYTSEQVLQDILNNVKKDEEGNPDTQGIQERIKQANMITLSIGANDVLSQLSPDLQLAPDKFMEIYAKMGGNIAKILAKIKELNAKAQLCLIGYYNPFPPLPLEQQKKLLDMLEQVNQAIKKAAEQFNATFVPTAEIIAQNKGFLPNPSDIHLSAEGYQAIANAIWNKMFPDEQSNEQPNEQPKEQPEEQFNKQSSEQFDFTDIAGHSAENNIKLVSAKGIVKGYPDGTFKPNARITFTEFVVMLMNTLQVKGAGETTVSPIHKDIPAWAQPAFAQAKQVGLLDGYEDGSFRPTAQITCKEMTTMSNRVLEQLRKTNTVTGPADDKAIGKPGITNDRKGNECMPDKMATRAEAVTTLLRIVEHQGE